MWKFVRNKGSHQPNAERQKLQKELFNFSKGVQYGFPSKPTALAWDPELRLIAIGTALGIIKVYGKPGVEFYGQLSSESSIMKILFVPGEEKLITMTDCNCCTLWQIRDNGLVEIVSLLMEGRVRQISTLYVEHSKKNLLIGTEGGNIYLVDLNEFKLNDDNIIYQDVAMQNVPEGKKLNPGSVEAISEQPNCPENILIGYLRGLMVLWNKVDSVVVQTYVNNQQIESFSWDTEGKRFLSSHNDGSYIIWSTESNESVEEPITVYGPFPCKAINKIVWCSCDSEKDDLIVFGGGMPRANYSDRHTVTIQKGAKNHVVLDFTSKLIDFVVTYLEGDDDVPEMLLVLLEEELVAIDLTTTEWKTIALPYLNSLHASSVTYITYVDEISENVWNKLVSAGEQQRGSANFSELVWPAKGGHLVDGFPNTVNRRDTIITGHEDGSVRFWNSGSVAMSLIYTFKTNKFFMGEDDLPDMGDPVESPVDEEEDEWPPFRKVGCFDPYSDDPRVSIKRVTFCPKSGILLTGGSAGQTIVAKVVANIDNDFKCKVTNIDLIPEKSTPHDISYQWKGAKKLPIRGTVMDNKVKLVLTPGFIVTDIVQINPPASITALALQPNWCLTCIGTSHGLCIFDMKMQAVIKSFCTLNASDFSTLNEAPISRTKSFKKSLRESFRRIRKGRSSVRHAQDKQQKIAQSPSSPGGRKRTGDSASSSNQNQYLISAIEAKPIERSVEGRPTNDASGNMIRCLFFYNSYINNSHQTTPSLWAGSNNGTVHIFILTVPGGSQRKNNVAKAQLSKEIQLRHRAPVINISIINLSHPLLRLNEPNERERPSHYAVITSEEQVKLFALPSLKHANKMKLTAMEGARIRRVALAIFKSPNHVETGLVILTNLGDCLILSLPDLKRQLATSVVKREDINAIVNSAFTNYGECIFMISSSEVQRISLSTVHKTVALCSLKVCDIKEKLVDAESAVTVASENQTINDSPYNTITNGIPEEDEEEYQDANGEPDNATTASAVIKTNKKETTDDANKSNGQDDSRIFNADISAITLDSIKDYNTPSER